MRIYCFQSAILAISFLVMISELCFSSPKSVTIYIIDENFASLSFFHRLLIPQS